MDLCDVYTDIEVMKMWKYGMKWIYNMGMRVGSVMVLNEISLMIWQHKESDNIERKGRDDLDMFLNWPLNPSPLDNQNRMAENGTQHIIPKLGHSIFPHSFNVIIT